MTKSRNKGFITVNYPNHNFLVQLPNFRLVFYNKSSETLTCW